MAKYEIEIKSLLGSKEHADKLIEKLRLDSTFHSIGTHKQLNHYFIGGSLPELFIKCKSLINQTDLKALEQISEHAKSSSVRTRQADDKVLLVVKASVDDTTSANGTARMEFESPVKLKLDELDKIILSAGFKYEAKWSRERQDFKYKELNVTIDKNAGYGYLAEFESIIDDLEHADATKDYIRKIMSTLNVMELDQNRLARMFDFYNKNWQDYYGTDKTFNIE